MKEFATLSNSICARLGIQAHRDVGQLKSGQICLANDSLFDQSTLTQEVTSYAIGRADPHSNQLQALLNFLAPVRPGPRKAIIKIYDTDEAFEIVDYKKLKRQPLGDFPSVKQRTVTEDTRKVPNLGLSTLIDEDQLIDKPNWEQVHTAFLQDMMTRASIIQAVALYVASAANANVIWDGLANPDMDIRSTNIQVLAAATGLKANRACYGEYATLLRQLAYESQNNAGAYARAAMMSDQQIAAATMLDRVLTNVERYNNAGSKDTFLGSKVLLFNGEDSESPMDASNIVRHVSNTVGGGQFAVYIQSYGKKRIITVEKYELFNAQHTDGMAVLNVSGV
jgi:hypothetical protein